MQSKKGFEFWLEKQLEFWLEIPNTKKMFKNGWFRHVPESKWNLKPFFEPKLKPKICLLNRLPEARVGRAPPARGEEERAGAVGLQVVDGALVTGVGRLLGAAVYVEQLDVALAGRLSRLIKWSTT